MNPARPSYAPPRPPRAGVNGVKIVLIAGAILIAALAVYLVVDSRRPSTSAEDALGQARDDLRRLHLALGMFQIQHGRYPTQIEGLDVLTKAPPSRWGTPTQRCLYTLNPDPWNRPYVYYPPDLKSDHPREFRLLSLGPDGKEGTADDVTSFE